MLGLCARVAPAVTLAGGSLTPDHARLVRAFVVSEKGPRGIQRWHGTCMQIHWIY